MMLVSRASSNTATNLRRTGKCALNFIEYNRDWMEHVVNLGWPGQTPEEKMEDEPFELGKSPTPEFRDDDDYPLIMHGRFPGLRMRHGRHVSNTTRIAKRPRR